MSRASVNSRGNLKIARTRNIWIARHCEVALQERNCRHVTFPKRCPFFPGECLRLIIVAPEMNHASLDRRGNNFKIALAPELALDEAWNTSCTLIELDRVAIAPLENRAVIAPEVNEIISDASDDFKMPRLRLPEVALNEGYSINFSKVFSEDITV